MKKSFLAILFVLASINLFAQSSVNNIKGTYIGELFGGAVSGPTSSMTKSTGTIQITDNGMTISNLSTRTFAFKPFTLSPIETISEEAEQRIVNKNWYTDMETTNGKYLLQGVTISLVEDSISTIKDDILTFSIQIRMATGRSFFAVFKGKKQTKTGITAIKPKTEHTQQPYDLSGRIARSHHKGIVIVNGKKTIR